MANHWSDLDPSGPMDGTETTIFIPSGGGLQKRYTYSEVFSDMMTIWEGELGAGDTPDGSEIVAATPSGGGPQKRFTFQDIADLAGGGGGGKTILTGNTEYFVSQTGDNANDGSANDDGHAWATLTYAYNWICENIDQSGYLATIKIVASGTPYVGLAITSHVNLTGPIYITSENDTDPTEVTLNDSGFGACVYLINRGSAAPVIFFGALTYDANGGDICIAGVNVNAYFGTNNVGITHSWIMLNVGYTFMDFEVGNYYLNGSLTIDTSSTLDFVFFTTYGSLMRVELDSITTANDLTFTTFLTGDLGSTTSFNSSSNVGTFTGSKYSLVNGADLREFNSGVPGDAPGTIEVYIVAGLPSSPGNGRRAFVSDALVPVYGSPVANGGSAFTPVYYDGSNWIVG